MKYLDYSTLFPGPGVELALFSTFQFDPDFFERRLLRSEGLGGARRIAVFMDGRKWSELRRREAPARWLNRRYLVVPVLQAEGVFHPKLALLMSSTGGQVLCGSNNLTRAGCSSNLELLNAVPYEDSDLKSDGALVAREAFSFFQRAAEEAAEPLRRILKTWLQETSRGHPWLTAPSVSTDGRRIRLLHTYTGALWDQLQDELCDRAPRAFFIMAPFHDARAEPCRRLTREWPKAKVELVVQQGYTNLQPGPLRKLRSVQLTEVINSSRRLHAKLIAWKGTATWRCIVGSANFTSAALDGPNTEACLLISDIEDPSSTLFDSQLKKRRIALDDFEPGPAEEPGRDSVDASPVSIEAAVLLPDSRLELSYSHTLGRSLSSLQVEVRAPSEPRPRVSIPLRIAPRATEVVALPEHCLTDTHGAVMATLSASVEGAVLRSAPVWIVQEHHLTHEPGGSTPGKRHQVEATGEGLAELLDEIGASEGVHGVVDFLRHLNIRFQDGSEGGPRLRPFRVVPRDPFVDDRLPDWILSMRQPTDTLEETIYDFVERHERWRLRKHADRGNINGMPNFVDIFAALTRLLFVYYRRGVVKRPKLIGKFCRLIALATIGRDIEEEQYPGYLATTYAHLARDSKLLQEACEETAYLAEVRAALLLVQDVRCGMEKKTTGSRLARPREMLEVWSGMVLSAIRSCSLREPTAEAVRGALTRHGVLQGGEIDRLLGELPT